MNTESNPANICHLIEQVSKGNERAALIMPDEARGGEISFKDLWQKTSVLSGNLRKIGLGNGDRVIIMIPMSIELYVTLLAVVKAGAIAVFVDPWISTRRMAVFASSAEPEAFIGIGKSHWLRILEPGLRKIELTVTTGRRWGRLPAKYSLKSLTSGRPDPTIETVHQDDPALITFTSGSSGEPKGANRTHGFLAAQHRALEHEFPYQPDDIDMPMFPVFALNNLVTGITSVIPEMDFRKVAEVRGVRIAEQMARHGVTTCTASPPFIDRLCSAVQDQGCKIPVRRFLTGGAPVTDEQLTNWRTGFATSKILVAYGSTEAEPVGHISADERLKLEPDRPGLCTGFTSQLIEARVIQICRNPISDSCLSLDELSLPHGEIGELIVSGEHVCRSYYKNPNATSENKFQDAEGNIWHRMGDTGYFDDQKRFWLTGRVHTTIVRDGKFIHPQLVEKVVYRSIQGLVAVAAVGMESHRRGQELWIVIVPGQACHNDVDEMKRTVVDSLQAGGISCDRVVVSEQPLPVDPRHNSKVDHEALKLRLKQIH